MTKQSLLPLKDQIKPIIDLYSKGQIFEALVSIKTLIKKYERFLVINA